MRGQLTEADLIRLGIKRKGVSGDLIGPGIESETALVWFDLELWNLKL